MSLRVVRLGTARAAGEGLRIGTVRRPPRGVPKERFAADGWYDLWLPLLAPSAELVKVGQGAETDAQWAQFQKKYRAEMAASEPAQAIALLAALSHSADFSVGCYCEQEARCHRSVLRQLLAAAGADISR
jgi:uncharacterized protein YeaO (DUF488 family)